MQQMQTAITLGDNMRKIRYGALVLAAIPGVASASSFYPSVGSPNSLHHSAMTTSLNLNDLDFDTEVDADGDGVVDPGYDNEGDADVIGGALTYWGSNGQEGQRYELRYQKQMRPFEASRARVLIDTPINILHANNIGTAVLATLSTGIELPVQPNWFITPRIAYGVTSASKNFFTNSTELLTLSATSRYKIAQVGRGDLTIGNMIAYSTTTDVGIGKKPIVYIKEEVVTFRNGLAYQLPLKGRLFGVRQGSIRASYVWTKITGDLQAYEDVHEVGVSIGVRTREVEQKNRFEQLRIGLLYTHGVSSQAKRFNFDAFTVTLGYRF